MNILTYSIVYITITLISKVKTEGVFLGPVICYYLNGFKFDCSGSNISPMKIPNECFSFVLDGTIFGDSNFVFDNLNDLFTTGKAIVMSLSHAEGKLYDYGTDDIQNKAIEDAEFITTIVTTYPDVKGIIIKDLDLTTYSGKFPQLAGNFNKYMSHIRDTFKALVFGVVLSASSIIDLFSNGNEGLELNVFDASVDFYMINFGIFNECTDDLIKGGVIPLGGDKPHTLEKLKIALGNLKLPKEKTYFKYPLHAISRDTKELTFCVQCQFSVVRMCEFPTESANWCADTGNTYNEKGKFALENGIGMALESINLDDNKKRCKCGKFPAFQRLLDGFNNGKFHKDCAKLDRT